MKGWRDKIAPAFLGAFVGVSGLISTINFASAHAEAAPARHHAAKHALPPLHLNIRILTGRMIHKPGWPKLAPANFTVPAGRRIIVTIRNLDDGAAPLVKGMDAYDRVTGTIGRYVIENGKRVTSINPKDVSHTFTVPGLGLNVPILPKAVTTFSFTASKPGHYTWQCMAPCGTGATGWGGAMAARGYMSGTVTVS